MKYLFIFISAVLVVAISGDSTSENIGSLFVKYLKVYESKCQDELQTKLTLMDTFSGDLDEPKACLFDCLAMKLEEDEKASDELDGILDEIEEKLQDKCDKHGDCEGINKMNKIDECLNSKQPQLNNCTFGEIAISCVKTIYADEVEAIKKRVKSS